MHLQKDNVCALVFKDIHSVHYERIYLSRNPDPYYKSNISVNLCRVAKIETYNSCYCLVGDNYSEKINEGVDKFKPFNVLH